MQFARYTRGGDAPTWGVRDGDDVYSLSGLPAGDPTYEAMANPSYRGTVESALESGALDGVAADEVRFLAPVPRPGKIVCVALNYRDHAEEGGRDVPESPVLFSKAPTAVTNPGDPIVYPADVEKLDYEVELGAVVGRTARHVEAADAEDYLAGYTVVNDVSARDAQWGDGQFFRGKSFDSFAPMGPVVQTTDAMDASDAAVSLTVNGETRQDSSTNQLVFSVAELVAFVTDAMTLRPGDVIATGTPAGVGTFYDPPKLLEPGDLVEATVEGVGTLANDVVAE